MNETMGQIIRRLRRERGMTQEELAEILGVTFQAVSKWENDAGMPDISQVVPLARVFGVSTDTLFGVSDKNDREEVMKILKEAQSCLSKPLNSKDLLRKYRILQEGLKQYPNDTVILTQCLETGLALSYPENGDLYDADNGQTTYKECIRYANLLISHSGNTSDIMRAHMIMVMLHSAYGNYKEAHQHIEQFPTRADYNIHVMYRYFAHWRKEFDKEIGSCQFANMHYVEAILNNTTQLAAAFLKTGQCKDAIKTLETELALIQCLFEDDEILPPIHYREQGDLFMLLAEAYLRSGDHEKALENLGKMVDYDLIEYEKITDTTITASPLLRAKAHEFYIKRIDRYVQTAVKLTDKRFAELNGDEKYQRLIDRINKQ
ncbi:MAG: helix-turn-helix transcriptional regulator [Clostridia bacterium]|nr:helix-turn-helix transcriptional regulator [Clostridia bacterium]